jgi:hypothetical protein
VDLESEAGRARQKLRAWPEWITNNLTNRLWGLGRQKGKDPPEAGSRLGLDGYRRLGTVCSPTC